LVSKSKYESDVKHDNVLWNATEVDKLAIATNQFCQPHNPFSHWHKAKRTPIQENHHAKKLIGLLVKAGLKWHFSGETQVKMLGPSLEEEFEHFMVTRSEEVTKKTKASYHNIFIIFLFHANYD
jgi:DNA phosphorothioation-dependent restriction protein DptG